MKSRTAVQTQEHTSTTSTGTNGALQRQCHCGQHTVAGSACAHCGQDRLQPHRATGGQSRPAPRPASQASLPNAHASNGFAASRFGHDFSRVPVRAGMDTLTAPTVAAPRVSIPARRQASSALDAQASVSQSTTDGDTAQMVDTVSTATERPSAPVAEASQASAAEAIPSSAATPAQASALPGPVAEPSPVLPGNQAPVPATTPDQMPDAATQKPMAEASRTSVADNVPTSDPGPFQTPMAEPAQAPAAEVAPSPTAEASQTPATEAARAPGAEPTPTSEDRALQPPQFEPDRTSAVHDTGPSQIPGAAPDHASEAEAAQMPADDEADTEPQASRQDPVPGLLVDDTARELQPGQMPVQEFLDTLQSAVRRVAEEALKGTGRSTEDCPYLEYWFDYYSKRSSRQVERAIRRYAPETSGVIRAREYIPYITERVRRGLAVWIKTGEVTEVPPGISAGLPASDPAERTATAGLLFKARAGGPRAVGDAQAVQAELGEGRPLDGGVRARMESAFGTSFAHVRTHSDARATELAHEMNARAFTVGAHVAFGAGEYRPGTPVGDALIAHELAHVVQQAGADATEAPLQTGGGGHQTLEEDADTAASGVMGLLWGGAKGMLAGLARNAMPRLRSGLQLQRCAPAAPTTTLPTPGSPLSIMAIPQAPPAQLVPPWGVPGDAGPLHLPFGAYQEFIRWSALVRSGFVVQELVTTYSATECATGTLNTDFTLTPHFWEAWEVDGVGGATPAIGGVNDVWMLGPRNSPTTQGNWFVDARVFWVPALDPAAGFAVGNVPESGDLLSTTTPPTNLGSTVVARTAGGTWDCTGAHTPA